MKNKNFINALTAAGLPGPLIDAVVGMGQLINVKSQTKLIDAGKE
jgi:hypothetical protein